MIVLYTVMNYAKESMCMCYLDQLKAFDKASIKSLCNLGRERTKK